MNNDMRIGERIEKYISIFGAPVWIMIGGIIGTVAITIGYCKYFIDLCYDKR